jgi:hypothetical protein
MTQKRKDWAAELAQKHIEATLNVPVQIWDRHGRQGAHDLRYELGNRSIAVEVKLVVNSKYRAMERKSSNTGYVRDNRLTRSWDARLRWGARVDRAQREIPGLLMRLERIGWHEGPLWELGYIDPPTEAHLDRLRITELWSQPPTPKHPPGFYLMPESWGGAVPGIEALPLFAARLLAGPSMARLRKQLADATVDERHAFLFIGWEHMEAMPLHDPESQELPPAPPPLPQPVDGVWLASLSTSTRVLAWVPGRGWLEGRTKPE